MKKALLISHDIGGFRPAFAYLSKTYRNLVCLVNGPALKEASQNFMNTINSFKEIELTEYDVYVSTGWASSFEKLHMKALQEHEVEWTGVLDNWTTYSERFVLDGVNYLPKQLMVFDEFALALCRATFPSVQCKLVPNNFDLEFVRSYEKLQLSAIAKPEFDIFFSDPISEQYGKKLGYNEFDQIRYILEKTIVDILKHFHYELDPTQVKKVISIFHF